MSACPLCAAQGETVLWRDARLRVILARDSDYPGFCRIIWNTHVREMTDLDDADRSYFMKAVFSVERVLREMLAPTKINLASLGNQVPHLHWHAIPRFTDDAHFPDPVWTPRVRDGTKHEIDRDALATKLSAVLSRP